MSQSDIDAILGRVVALETILIGLFAERAGQEPEPDEYVRGVRNAIRGFAQNAPWDAGGDPQRADRVAQRASEALDYLFARISERVR